MKLIGLLARRELTEKLADLDENRPNDSHADLHTGENDGHEHECGHDREAS